MQLSRRNEILCTGSLCSLLLKCVRFWDLFKILELLSSGTIAIVIIIIITTFVIVVVTVAASITIFFTCTYLYLWALLICYPINSQSNPIFL